jgi:alkylated DNA repair dioxygenase AlkB
MLMPKRISKNGAIASMSFELIVNFQTQRKQRNRFQNTQNGSLLVMKDETQSHWLHRLPPTKLVGKPRVNLTFRTIVIGR